jgi:hypothetical protein
MVEWQFEKAFEKSPCEKVRRRWIAQVQGNHFKIVCSLPQLQLNLGAHIISSLPYEKETWSVRNQLTSINSVLLVYNYIQYITAHKPRIAYEVQRQQGLSSDMSRRVGASYKPACNASLAHRLRKCSHDDVMKRRQNSRVLINSLVVV